MKAGLFVCAAVLGCAAGVFGATWQTAYPAEAASGFEVLEHGSVPYLYCERLLWLGDSATVTADVAAERTASGTVLAVGCSNDTDTAHGLYDKNRIRLVLESGAYGLYVRGTKVGESAAATPGRRTVALTMARASGHVTAFRVLEDGRGVLEGSATLEGGGVNSLCFGSDFGASAASGVTVFGAQVCRAEGSLTAGIPPDGELALIGVSPDWRALGDASAFAVRRHEGTAFYEAGSGMIYADCSGSLAFEATAEDGASGTLAALGYANTDTHALAGNNRIVAAVADGAYTLSVRGAEGTAGTTVRSEGAAAVGRRSCLLTVARTADHTVTARLFVGGVLQCEAVQKVTSGPINAVCVGSAFGESAASGMVFGEGVARWATGVAAGLASVPDAEAALRGSFEFAVENGAATVSAYRGAGVGAVTVPEWVPESGEPVTALAEGLFFGRSGLTSVTLPQSVTRIGARAFAGCTGLTAVSGAEALTEIGEEAFLKCFALEAAPLPERVASVGARAFGWCSGLRGALTLPAGLTALGEAAFAGCTGLTSVTGGGALTAVPAGAFGGCTALTTVALPGVTAVGRQAFWNCPRLAEAAFGTLSAIGRQAFYRCAALKALSFPASASVGYGAFDGCAGLPTDGAGWRYADAAHTELLSAPAGLTGEVTVPTGVRRIHSAAFGAAPGVLAVTLPDTAEAIGDEAFYACRGATFRFASTEPPAVTGAWAFPAVTGSAPWTLTPSVGFYPQGAAAWEAVGASWQGLTLMGWARPGYRIRLK